MKKIGLTLPLLMLPGAAAMAQPGYASLCEVQTALPSYGAGTFQPITCSTNGALAVQIVGGVNATTAIVAQTLSVVGNNATNIKATAGTLDTAYALNTGSTLAYLKFYDTNGIPQCGTTTVKFTVPLVQNVPANLSPPNGISFPTGIGICIVGGQGVTDNTSASTGISVTTVYQ